MSPEDVGNRLTRIQTVWTLVFQANRGKEDPAVAAQQQLLLRYRGAVYRVSYISPFQERRVRGAAVRPSHRGSPPMPRIYRQQYTRPIPEVAERVTLTTKKKGANGSEGFHEALLRHHGQRVRPPQRPEHRPEAPFLNWHLKEVFKGTARHVA
jgi:hypothetical protein